MIRALVADHSFTHRALRVALLEPDARAEAPTPIVVALDDTHLEYATAAQQLLAAGAVARQKEER